MEMVLQGSEACITVNINRKQGNAIDHECNYSEHPPPGGPRYRCGYTLLPYVWGICVVLIWTLYLQSVWSPHLLKKR